jgi:hypothetical protein
MRETKQMELSMHHRLTNRLQRQTMVAKLANFTNELLKHPEYNRLVFVLHEGGVSGFRFAGRHTRSRMFHDGDRYAYSEPDGQIVTACPAGVILCGIARRMEVMQNGQPADIRVTVHAFTSAAKAQEAVNAAPPHTALWVYPPLS